MRKWTDRQQEAITARSREVLVSAAAGSGKTSVLIQRVMALLLEGVPLDRMLVVTFTHAAADEMKTRLTDLLSEAAGQDPRLKKQYLLLGRADICTLHSFCQKVIRRHFQAAGTDPLSRPADELLAGELFDAAADQALESFYMQTDADAKVLMDRFSDREIEDMVGRLYRFLMAQDSPWEWLDSRLAGLEQGSLYDHPWYEVMRREVRLILSGAEDLLRTCRDLCERADGPARYLMMIQDDLALLDRLREQLRGDSRSGFPALSFSRLSTKAAGQAEDPEVRERTKDLRDRAKELIRQAMGLLPSGEREAEEWMGEVRATLPPLRALAGLVRDTHGRYMRAKAERALWDFYDMEHLALKALTDPQIAREVAGAYDALFVDEYQDISSIQEAIIRRLHDGENTLFMVGDVKQSIYRFRLADPNLFLQKSRDFKPGGEAGSRLITLRENFRSRPQILKAVNLVFDFAMRSDATEISYDDEARLVPQDGLGEGPPVELWLIEKGEDEPAEEESLPDDLSLDEATDEGETGETGEETPPKRNGGEMERAFVYEARLIARRVSELLGTPIPDGKGTRPLQLRDVAVLLRAASGRAAVIAEILCQAGIQAYSDADSQLYAQQEVRDLIALLQVLDNPRQDTPLLHVLSCPVFSFSPADLARVRQHDPRPETSFSQAFFSLAETDPACRGVLDTLGNWRFMAANMPLEQFIRYLLRQSGLYAAAGAKEDGGLRRANLRLLAAGAAPMPEPQTLGGFLRRTITAMKGKAGARSASIGMQENVVRIMTIHKSKGLEFPVVFLPDLAASFSRRQKALPLWMDAGTGLAMETVVPEARLKREGFGVRAIRIKKSREELSEEARLLYVGMTRAKERLILIGAPENASAAMARWAHPTGDYAAGSAACMLDWVCTPLYPALSAKRDGLWDAPGGGRWMLSRRMTGSLPAAGNSAAPANLQTLVSAPGGDIGRLFAFPASRPSLPLKSSVTALVTGRAGIETEDEEETPALKRRELQFDRPPMPLPRLAGGEQLTGAQRGAAAHKALCALDPSRFIRLEGAALKDALAQALMEMQGQGLLRAEEAEALDTGAIEAFFFSDLARRMADSAERHAEWPFTLKAEGGVILQGVLDACFLEDGAWVLVDYKTDWGDPDELANRYRDQMRWYMRALRDITGLPVKEAWLYLLRLGQAVRMEENEPIRLRTGGGEPGDSL